MRRVVVGMSGGVDSAAAAWLLQAAGWSVIGLTLRTWLPGDGKESRCCEIDAARETAELLGIPYYVRSWVPAFRERITAPFVRDYLHGRTPNPCVYCNREIKWPGLLEAAQVLGADCVATGHYAAIAQRENGRLAVRQGADRKKDQSYMLARLTQEQLAATLLPLGNLTKAEVRRIAAQAGLPSAKTPDSQELCFVPDGNYADFIEEQAGDACPGCGDFLSTCGEKLGTHQGIYRYTVGQRRGLGLALGRPAYVQRLDAQRNAVVIGDAKSLETSRLICDSPTFMGIPAPEPFERFRAAVRIRYHHSGQTADVYTDTEGHLCAELDAPVRAAAPGQTAVCYGEDGCVLCAGVIAECGE